MTDLELTRKCAEAMAWKPSIETRYTPHDKIYIDGQLYAPLHDDAQCFALVKKFGLNVQVVLLNPFLWRVTDYDETSSVEREDVNRAIVECVANMEGR